MSDQGRAWVLPTVVLALLAVAVPIAGLLLSRSGVAVAPVRWVEVSGSFERVTAEQVRSAMTPALRGGFFFLPLDQVRAQVLTLNWVESAEVRKRWPDTVEVRLTERNVLARLGRDRLIDQKGRIFAADGRSAMGGIPRFDVAESAIDSAIAFYQQIHPDLQGLGLDLSVLAISRRGSYALTLSNGIEVMVGSRDQQARWQRLLVGLRPLLDATEQPIARIDLRYTNGFAVRLQVPASEADAVPDNSGEA